VFSRFLAAQPRLTIGPTWQFGVPSAFWPVVGDEAVVPTFLVERYVPRAGSAHPAGIAEAAQAAQVAEAAAGRAPDSPGPVRYLAVTLVPGDELCYCLFEAPSVEAVRRAHELAQISCERIVEAFHVTAHTPGNQGSTP
jgi:Protein of unknown function (DUF4242)